MKSFTRILIAVAAAACLLLTAGCAQSGTQPDSRAMQEAQQDIQDLNSALVKAYNSMDAAAVAACFTDNAILMPPNQGAVKTKIAIESFMRQTLVPPMTGMLLNPVETDVAGDYAFSSGYYSVLGANGAITDRGKFLEVLKSDGRTWHIYRDIYNSDMAAPQAGATAAPPASTTAAPAASTH